MGVFALPRVADGVLLSAGGRVHERMPSGYTACATLVPGRFAPVSHLQVQVFKLPLCVACYPLGGRS